MSIWDNLQGEDELMFAPVKDGTAWLYSELDRRWNYSIRVAVGGFTKPEELGSRIEELKRYMAIRPKDLE